MEDVLDLYAEAPDPMRPVVCFDESPVDNGYLAVAPLSGASSSATRSASKKKPARSGARTRGRGAGTAALDARTGHV
jgi:hypothetical protein